MELVHGKILGLFSFVLEMAHTGVRIFSWRLSLPISFLIREYNVKMVIEGCSIFQKRGRLNAGLTLYGYLYCTTINLLIQRNFCTKYINIICIMEDL